MSKAFAEIVEQAEDDVLVIDMVPTGHTLLLLDSAYSYNREIERADGDARKSTRRLLPRTRDSRGTEVIIVTLPGSTPFYEAVHLEEDLKRVGTSAKGGL